MMIPSKIKASLTQWLDSLDDRIESIKIEIGAQSKSTQIGMVSTQAQSTHQIQQSIISLAQNSGWGEDDETRKIRLYGASAKGDTLSTFQRTLPPAKQPR